MRFISSTPTIISRGKPNPHRMPARRLSPKALATAPATVGPAEQPRSPASAISANRAVPPRCMEADAVLNVPGQKMPTEKPHRPTPIRPVSGLCVRPMSRYAATHRPQQPSMVLVKSILSPRLP